MADGAGKCNAGRGTEDGRSARADLTADLTADLAADLTADLAVGLTADELTLRDLMHRSVAEIQPDPGGLPRIRTAVPRRRAARRGAWTGAAALAVAVAIALPALHTGDRLGLSGGPGSPHANDPAATSPTGTVPDGSTAVGVSPHPDPGGPGGTGQPSGTAGASPSATAGSVQVVGGATTAAAASSSGDDLIVPLCTRGDLGQGGAHVGPADAGGRIYGWFAVTNVSGRSCRLGGPGAVAVTAVTGTDRSRIRVTDHTAGDPATGLPVADTDPPVLAPQGGYRVPFAWIPDPVCPATGPGTATAAPTGQSLANPAAFTTDAPAATGAPATGAAAAPTSNAQPSASPTAGPTSAPSPTATPTQNPTTPTPPSATIAHTPAPGSPTAATAVLPGACAGTVYRGGVQASGGPAQQASGTPSAG
ncbi:hypothetical protein F7Q99_14175 [Streptomyces kaniharaensis]|uniref:DUF4232 domain-containing protein n=1 Tax=Streptomyces kaniharaensis TaxID=212423 RepID=A0A6N7KSS2_9ACTN|nr:hypothetical protein [Streptomyces kaniharaensis]MQS13388.1 hypothetical protein [Streptomyces kaniharaensis]